MSGFALVAGVIGIFFVAGVVMGVLVVAVLSRWRGRRYMRGRDWYEFPTPRADDERPPRWPGD